MTDTLQRAITRMRADYTRRRESLIESLKSLEDTAKFARMRMEKCDLDEELELKRMCLPINTLGVVQGQGALIDNAIGELAAIYDAIKLLTDLQNAE